MEKRLACLLLSCTRQKTGHAKNEHTKNCAELCTFNNFYRCRNFCTAFRIHFANGISSHQHASAKFHICLIQCNFPFDFFFPYEFSFDNVAICTIETGIFHICINLWWMVHWIAFQFWAICGRSMQTFIGFMINRIWTGEKTSCEVFNSISIINQRLNCKQLHLLFFSFKRNANNVIIQFYNWKLFDLLLFAQVTLFQTSVQQPYKWIDKEISSVGEELR